MQRVVQSEILITSGRFRQFETLQEDRILGGESRVERNLSVQVI